MNIRLIPYTSESNQYINLISDAIRLSGHNVIDKKALDSDDLKQIDILILNWYENLPKNGCKALCICALKTARLIKYKLLKKQLIWVVHNKIPHERKHRFILRFLRKHRFLSRFLMKVLFRLSDKVIIHSDATVEVLRRLDSQYIKRVHKVVKIPHPSYIDVYKSQMLLPRSDDGKLRILFLGNIRLYKNVDMLIRCFDELGLCDVILTIAGKCADQSYAEYIRSISKKDNILFKLRFIEDDKIEQLMADNDIVALPYSDISSLNSGAIILSFSYKKTVISPLIGTLMEYEDKSFFYSYEYTSPKDHVQQLKASILQAYNDYKSDSTILQKKGEIAYSKVKIENSIEVLAEKYADLFSRMSRL